MQDATQNSSEYQLDERFFSQPPQAWDCEYDDWQLRPLSSLERLAMLLTVAPLIMSIAVAITWLFCAGL